ncbi:MAG: DUF4340 domain-containing protein [Candidatus Omnitrophica bacterium]|nr:DUF4340 domain-containing protein [Candidatus Omnitrophota bacterium]
MRWKTTVVLLVATIGIGVYVSLYEIKQPTREEAQRHSKRVINVEPNDVTQVVLDLPNAKTTLNRNGSAWTMTPHNLRADAALVEALLDDFSPLISERILTPTAERPVSAKEFGLEPAVGWVSIATEEATATLLFGDETPVGRGRYVKLSAKPEVFIISSRPFESLNQPPEHFRDRRLFGLSSWSCQRLAVASPQRSYELLRSDKTWKLAAPIADDADRAAVSALLGHLERMEIRRFISDAPPAQLDPAWGLNQPTTQLTVRAGDPAQEIAVVIGKPLADDAALLHAKRSDEPSIYAIAAADLEPVMKPADELRSKACFTFFTGNVTKVSAQWGAQPAEAGTAKAGASWTIQRDGEAWTAQQAATPLERGKVEAFLNALADARLVRFVDAAGGLSCYGLDKPEGVVAIWTGEQEPPQQLEIGSTVKGEKTRYGRLVARGAIAVLPESLVGTVSTTTLDQLKAVPPNGGGP